MNKIINIKILIYYKKDLKLKFNFYGEIHDEVV